MNLSRLLLLSIALLSFAACKKIGNSTVVGTVVEKGTGLPFQGIQVWAVRTTRSGMNSELDPRIVATTVTDADGHYELNFPMRARFIYDIYCTYPQASSNKTYSEVGWHDIPDKDNVVDFELPPLSYVKLRIHKTTVAESLYSVIGVNGRSSFNFDLPSMPYDSILGVYPVMGNDSIHISWAQKYDPPYPFFISDSDNIYVGKGDTADYTVNFY